MTLRMLTLMLLLPGCADDRAVDSNTEQPQPPAGPCSLEDKIGVFQVMHELDYTAVSGEVANGVVPSTILEEAGAEGGCRLMRRNNPFCDPPCSPGETCDFDGACIPYPEPRSVGNVTIVGLNAEVSMDPPLYFNTTPPHPGFDPGVDISLVAAGEDYGSFVMWGVGVTPVAVSEPTWIVHRGQPLDVAWTAADDGEHVGIQLRLNVDQHGASPVMLICDLPDSGSVTISSTLIDALLDYGVSGYASGDIYRRTVDHVDVADGCIQFEVFSHIPVGLQAGTIKR